MDTTKVGNNKYFHGKYVDAEATRGWFVGSFLPEGDKRKTDHVDVNNVISGEFLAPTKFFAIHSPSIPTDKVTL